MSYEQERDFLLRRVYKLSTDLACLEYAFLATADQKMLEAYETAQTLISPAYNSSTKKK